MMNGGKMHASDFQRRGEIGFTLLHKKFSTHQPDGPCFLHFAMIQNYTNLYSSNWPPQRRQNCINE